MGWDYALFVRIECLEQGSRTNSRKECGCSLGNWSNLAVNPKETQVNWKQWGTITVETSRIRATFPNLLANLIDPLGLILPMKLCQMQIRE